MKRMILLLLCLGTLSASGQGWKSSALKSRPVSKFRYKVDTLQYKGQPVAIQRYDMEELGMSVENGATDHLLKLHLYRLQSQMDLMKEYMLKGEPGYRDDAEGTLEKVIDADKNFNTTNYEQELAFYRKICGVKSKIENAADERREKERQDSISRELEMKRKRFALRDPNVIADEDRELASWYTGVEPYGSVERMAWEKINRIEEAEERRQLDSYVNARMEQIYLQLMEEEKKQKAEAQAAKKKRKADLIAKYGTEVGGMIASGKVAIGMSTDMCAAAWGRPADIRKITTAKKERQQWVYGKGKYLYFDNNVLAKIQE
ncbi:hypothetical protein [Nemorincola caseinilytica]